MTLVQTERDVDSLDIPHDTPVAYVTQTTLSVDDTRGIIAALHKKFTDIVGPETRDICYATQNRRDRGARTLDLVDVILVVAPRSCSNSDRLREIGNEAGIPAILLPTAARGSRNGSTARRRWASTLVHRRRKCWSKTSSTLSAVGIVDASELTGGRRPLSSGCRWSSPKAAAPSGRPRRFKYPIKKV